MNHPYGPWATLITAGQNPQLSAFWRRRMGLLVSVSKANLSLSRRSVVSLAAVAFFVLFLPTFRPMPVTAQDEKASKTMSRDQKNDARFAEPSLAPSSPARGDAAVMPPAGSQQPPLFLPGYKFLRTSSDCKSIGIGDEQEKKLRRISADVISALRKLVITKEIEQLPQKERSAKLEEIERAQQEITKRFRPRIAAVLTAQQQADYQRLVRGKFGLSLLSDPKPVNERWGIRLTQPQNEQLGRLEEMSERESQQRIRQFKDRLLEVLTPEQRQRLAEEFAEANVAGPSVDIPDPSRGGLRFNAFKTNQPYLYLFLSSGGASLSVYGELANSEVRKQLGLNAQQEAKLQAVLSDSQAAAEKVFAVCESKPPAKLSPEEQESRRAEYREKLEKLGKDIIRQIDATLTQQQLAALNQAGRQERQFQALLRPDRKLPAIGATPEQKAKLQQVFQQYVASNREPSRVIGEKAWLILAPEQVKKVEKLIDRDY